MAKRHRTAFDRHHPDARHGLGPAGERRPSGNGDGARAARLPPLPRGDGAQPRESAVAGPRPLHPLRGARVHPPVQRPASLRLQPLARGAEAVPAMGVVDARTSGAASHARHRGDDRSARPGVRERRGLRDRGALSRGALQPALRRDRRPPRLLHLLGRRPDGGRVERGGVGRRNARPRKLIYYYDDNNITIDGTTWISFTEDAAPASRRKAGTCSTCTTRTISARCAKRPRMRRPRRRSRRSSSSARTSGTAHRTPSTRPRRTALRSARTRYARRRKRSAGIRTRSSTCRTRCGST